MKLLLIAILLLIIENSLAESHNTRSESQGKRTKKQESNSRRTVNHKRGYVDGSQQNHKCHSYECCEEWQKTFNCQLYGFSWAYCDTETKECVCGPCDPCNCAKYCADYRLNPQYGLTIGTCQYAIYTNGKSEAEHSRCVCSSPPPKECIGSQACYPPYGGCQDYYGYSDDGSGDGDTDIQVTQVIADKK